MIGPFRVRVTVATPPCECDTHPWQVRIEDAKGTLVGIPTRGVTEPEAIAASRIARAAFNYGLIAFQRCVQTLPTQVRLCGDKKHDQTDSRDVQPRP